MTVSPNAASTDRQWARFYLALYVVYVGLGLLARATGWLHVDAIWFVEAGRRVLDGSFDLYSFRPPEGIGIAPPDGLAFSYSPLVALLVAPFVGLAELLGGGQNGAAVLIAVPWLLADVLAMHELRRLVRAWRPAADERFLALGILLTLGLTGFWQVSAYRGHHEGLVLLFLLLALRLTPQRLVLGGLCAGLALAAKQTAVLELIPLGLVLLGVGGGQHGTPPRSARRLLQSALVWGGVAGGVFAAFMLPALLRNPAAVGYAFVTQEGRRVLLGPGLPVWLDRAAQAGLAAPTYEGWHAALLGWANVGLLLVAVVVPLLALWWAGRRGVAVGLTDARLLALVAFGGVAQIIFAKWVSGHYYQLPLALVFLWDMVRTAPRPDADPAPAAPVTLLSFPLIGLGAAIAFRSITPFDTPAAPWLKDALLFALFAALALATVRSVKRET